MTTEFLDNLVVVVANHSVLRVKRRKLGVVFHQRLVLSQHLERLAENTCLGKDRQKSQKKSDMLYNNQKGMHQIGASLKQYFRVIIFSDYKFR